MFLLWFPNEQKLTERSSIPWSASLQLIFHLFYFFENKCYYFLVTFFQVLVVYSSNFENQNVTKCTEFELSVKNFKNTLENQKYCFKISKRTILYRQQNVETYLYHNDAILGQLTQQSSLPPTSKALPFLPASLGGIGYRQPTVSAILSFMHFLPNIKFCLMPKHRAKPSLFRSFSNSVYHHSQSPGDQPCL